MLRLHLAEVAQVQQVLRRQRPDRVLVFQLGRQRVSISVKLAEDPLQHLEIQLYCVEVLIAGADAVLAVILQDVLFVRDVQMDDCPQTLQKSLSVDYLYRK